MTGNGHNTQEELASYAMQNLPVEESASIRAHLQTCAPCRDELSRVGGDLALIGLAVDQQADTVYVTEIFQAGSMSILDAARH